MRGPLQQNRVNGLLGQQKILLGPDLGNDLVVEHDDPILHGVADGQVAFAVFDPQIVGRHAADIQNERHGDGCKRRHDRHRRRVGLREAGHIINADGIGLVLVSKADSAPTSEESGK